MSDQGLAGFWQENKDRIGKALPEGIDALASILQTGADRLGLVQEVSDERIHWTTPDGELAVMFCRVADPRDLDRVTDVYVQARELRPSLTAVFVHQWTDGEGNWDAFAITPDRAVRHGDRIWGSRTVQEQGPALREDVYTLFSCDRGFPEPGSSGWAELLAGPVQGVLDQLDVLARGHQCTQAVDGNTARWANPSGELEAQFVVLPDPSDIDGFVRIYEGIRERNCPVSFVFLNCEERGVYDIFRLSARSYLEHHNQAKRVIQRRPLGADAPGRGAKILDGLKWVPRWTSHVGCIKGCLDYLGVDVSDAWLFGATGHAFVLNIKDDLCASGPTDWDTERFVSLGRNVGYLVDEIGRWCPEQDRDLAEVQQEAWDFVRNCIDDGLPCYGWELDVPDFYVIYGYDETGYFISGPGCDDGAGPVPWQDLGRSEIQVVAVSSVRPAEPAEDKKAVLDALSYAVGHGRRKGRSDSGGGYGGLQGFDAWIRAMETGKAGEFGVAYNAAVWAECRRFAVDFLEEARQRLHPDLDPPFREAIRCYQTVSDRLKAVCDAYPFSPKMADRPIEIDDRTRVAAVALRHARDAEAAGLEQFAQLGEIIPTT